MLKLLTIATLALCLSNVAWTQAQGPKNQAEHNTPKPIQPIPSVVQGEPTPDRKPSGYQWKELVAPANIPNWFLVLVGAWAGWMALGTLNEIRAQTEVNRVSAEAALLNAQAVINAERARILIEFKKVLPP